MDCARRARAHLSIIPVFAAALPAAVTAFAMTAMTVPIPSVARKDATG